MSATQLMNFTMKIQENMTSSQNELFNENKKINKKLTDIQSKFDERLVTMKFYKARL